MPSANKRKPYPMLTTTDDGELSCRRRMAAVTLKVVRNCFGNGPKTDAFTGVANCHSVFADLSLPLFLAFPLKPVWLGLQIYLVQRRELLKTCVFVIAPI